MEIARLYIYILTIDIQPSCFDWKAIVLSNYLNFWNRVASENLIVAQLLCFANTRTPVWEGL
jgi:hypothetical protein